MHLTNPQQHKERYVQLHFPDEYAKIKKLPGKWVEQLYRYEHNVIVTPKCPVCGAELKFKNATDGFATYCKSCTGKSSAVINARTNTMLKLYGVPHYTNRKKFAETCKSRYGVSNPNHLPTVREKISNTNKERYGGIGFSSLTLKQKTLDSIYALYGATNIRQADLHESYPELIDFNGPEWMCTCPHLGCNKCQSKTYITNQRTHYTRKKEGTELCTNLLPIRNIDTKDTSIEIFVRNILDSHKIVHIDNSFDIIPPKQIDIYCPDYHVGFEINGTRWHSDRFHSAKSALHKKQICETENIKLITIWEDQINRIPEIVESVVLSKLGIYKRRLCARKCTIKEIDSKCCSNFLEHNHIQGRTSSQVRLGAYINDELVGVMTFIQSRGCQGSKVRAAGQWELNRFCTLLNTQVIGLTSKMLKYFIRHYNPTSVISFSHNDISDGDVYSKLGFTKIGRPNTSYYYIKSNVRYHRSNFTRAGIVRRWPEYDINDRSWTERQVMNEKNYYRIYDCGTQKWILYPQ